MPKNLNRAKQNQENSYIAKSWQRVINNGAFFFVRFDKIEEELARKLLHFNEKDLEIGILCYDLGLQHAELGDFPRAIEYLENALAAYWFNLECDDPEAIELELILAKFYQIVGRYEDAQYILEETQDNVVHIYGVKSKQVKSVKRQLVDLYRTSGKVFKAIDLLDELIEQERENETSNQESIAELQIELSKSYRRGELLVEALNFLSLTLEENEIILPPDHDKMGLIYWELALCYKELGCYQEALRLSKIVEAMELKNEGFACADMANILEFQGGLFYKLGEWEKSQDRYQEAFLLFWKIYGAEDEDTKRVKKHLEEF